jgi:hypothetical protein
MNRTRDYYRRQRKRAIAHKLGILFTRFPYDCYEKEKNEKGRLSKGKVHCSCSMCSPKTNMKAKFRKRESGSWRGSPLIFYKISENRKIDSINQQLYEFEEKL